MFMRGKLTRNLTKLFLTGLLLAVAGSVWAANNRFKHDSAASGLQEVSFTLTRLPENPRQYSLVLSDSDEHAVSGNFSVDQLKILRAVMAEAEKFALSSEAVGDKDPVTTRFMDKQENAFIVDVEKAGNLSRLYLTLKTEIGRMTVDAGKVIRSSRREEGFYFDLLSRLESVLPKAPPNHLK